MARIEPHAVAAATLSTLRAAIALALVCAAIPVAVAGGAAEESAAEPAWSLRSVQGAQPGGFYRAHLLPRLIGQFKPLAAHPAIPQHPDMLGGTPLVEEFTDFARRRAERGTKKALKAFLLEATSLGRAARRVDGARNRERAESEKRYRWDARIAHGRPGLNLRRKLGAGTLRVGVDFGASLGLEYRKSGPNPARFSARYDARDREIAFACRFSF